jgi:hypothetical protein
MEDAINDAMLHTGKNSSVLIMPYGGSTLPVIEA